MKVKNVDEYGWAHPIGTVVTALTTPVLKYSPYASTHTASTATNSRS